MASKKSSSNALAKANDSEAASLAVARSASAAPAGAGTRAKRAANKRQAISFVKDHISPSGRDMLALLGMDVKDLFKKEDRGLVPQRITKYSDLVEPPYNPWQLQDLYETQWVVRMCVDKLVRESTRQGYKFAPRYEVKCDTCETEFSFNPVSGVCPACASTMATTAAGLASSRTLGSSKATTTATSFGHLSPPDPGEYERAEAFLEHPNPNGLTVDDLLKRAVKDLLIFDDFYQSIALNKDETGPFWQRMELWPEDARMIRMLVDAKGHFGGKAFCQVCEAIKPVGDGTKFYPPADIGKECPSCHKSKLVPVAYAQVKGNETVAAWTKDEMIHGNLWAIGSKLFGTPKLWAIQTQVTAMALIDRFQKDAFDKTSTPKNIYLVKGITRDSLNATLRMHEQAKDINPMSDLWIPLPTPTTGAANFGIEKIPGLDSPLITGSLPFQEFYMKAICMTFGVSPSAIGVETPGRLGTGAAGIEQHDVTPETINEIQRQVSEIFDQFLKKFFPEIQDWYFSLETAHEKETLDEWTVKKLQLDAAKVAVDSGFDVIIDEDGTPKISGTGKQPQPPAPFGGKGPAEGGKSAATAASVGNSIKKQSIYTEDELEKASKFQRTIKQGAKVYKEQLDAFSTRIFDALKEDYDSVLTVSLPEDNHVTADLKMTLLGRTTKILDHYLAEGERLAKDAASHLYQLGRNDAATDTGLITKQDDGTYYAAVVLDSGETIHRKPDDSVEKGACNWITTDSGQHICIGGGNFLHGTSVERAQSIKRTGLKVHGRSKSVFFTDAKNQAHWYGQGAAGDGKPYAIVEFKVPPGEQILHDEMNNRHSFRMQRNVPSSWITKVTLYDSHGKEMH